MGLLRGYTFPHRSHFKMIADEYRFLKSSLFFISVGTAESSTCIIIVDISIGLITRVRVGLISVRGFCSCRKINEHISMLSYTQ